MSKGPCPYHRATPKATRWVGRLEPTEWLEPKWPGDSAVQRNLIRSDGDIGSIRIQVYGPTTLLVASYLPGHETGSPGDTPKVNPERSAWCTTRGEASKQFAAYCIAAFREGWRNLK